jgi:hypothetical protein
MLLPVEGPPHHLLLPGDCACFGHPGVLRGRAGRPAGWYRASSGLQVRTGPGVVSASATPFPRGPSLYRGKSLFYIRLIKIEREKNSTSMFCCVEESSCKYFYDSIRKSVLGQKPAGLKHCNRCNTYTQVSSCYSKISISRN